MKKFLALALALVMALSLGVTAFADDDLADIIKIDGHWAYTGATIVDNTTDAGIAGGWYENKVETSTIDWVWNVYETTKAEYCRIAVDFRYDEVDIYVCPDCVGLTLLENGKWTAFDGWDWDEDSFEVFADGPFTYKVTEVTKHATNYQYDEELPYVVAVDGAVYPIYTDGTSYYILAKLGDHNVAKYWEITAPTIDLTDATQWSIDDGDTKVYAHYIGTALTLQVAGDITAADVTLVTEARTFDDHDFYQIAIYPVDDYGVNVVRGSIYFKMIDYTSGRTNKFTSAPLYIDFFHVDVYDKDVYKVAGEKKAMVLDDGEPYDNKFDCGKHDHDGGITMWPEMFYNGLYDYDCVYWDNEVPDIISAENFDEGVGKTLKVTNLDKTWELQIDKVAEYQPGVNFTTNTTVADVIAKAFPNAKFQAVNFLTTTNGVIYKSASKLLIAPDAKALGLKGESTIYVYKYVGGVLEYQDAFTYNFYKGTDAYPYVELAAGDSLGSYYLSDTDLRTAPAGEENPNTGANDVVGVAVALAVVSLVAAAAVSLKK